MVQVPFRTNYRLWALAAGCVFVALAFVDFTGGLAKQSNSLGSHAGHLVGSNGIDEGAVSCVLFLTALLALPSAAVGWVAQALVVVAWSSVRARRSNGVPNGVPPTSRTP